MLKEIYASGFTIRIKTIDNTDYLSLTDLAKYKSQHTTLVIRDWIRQKSTIQFLTVWEELYNPDFQKPELNSVKTEKNSNYSSMSPSQWIKKTNAIGIVLQRGGSDSGIFAHKDIAMEFVTWFSPKFKLYVIKELQRLKEEELQRLKEEELQRLKELPNRNEANPEWLTSRTLARANYSIQTDAIQKYLTKDDTVLNPHYVYATEADLLNLIIFGMTAKQFREVNPHVQKDKNLRDFGDINQLLLVVNLEGLNSMQQS